MDSRPADISSAMDRSAERASSRQSVLSLTTCSNHDRSMFHDPPQIYKPEVFYPIRITPLHPVQLTRAPLVPTRQRRVAEQQRCVAEQQRCIAD